MMLTFPTARIRVGVYSFPLVLGAISLALVGVYWLAGRLMSGTDHVAGYQNFADMFDLNGETNIPAWFSVLLWATAALLAWVASHAVDTRSDRWHWRGLSALFLFLSMDEGAEFHETVGNKIDIGEAKTGFLYYDWVVYGGVLLLAVGLVFARFLLTRSLAVQIRIYLSAVVFVSGALAMEMIGAAVDSGFMAYPPFLNQFRQIAIEEFFEMAGVTLLIHALLYAIAEADRPGGLMLDVRGDT